MRIIVAVSNDLVTDQRVHRSCFWLHQNGYAVKLVGRRLKNSLPMDLRPYAFVRLNLIFSKGPLFYASFNIRLFWLLFFSRFDAVWANDLDTLWACRLASRLKRKKIVFDSHEYFTGVPELVSRPRVQRFWKKIEQRIVPKLPFLITVNDSIASLFKEEYNIPVFVIRNVPSLNNHGLIKSRNDLCLPANKRILIIQGRGINVDRGVEEAVLAMKYVEGALLLIIGGGDVFPFIKKLVVEEKLSEKVRVIDTMPSSELRHFTANADIGITLDKDTNMNYRFSLPNKVFDYIHAGIAVLSSDLPELRNIITSYNIGVIACNHDPKQIALHIIEMISDEARLNVWKQNASNASAELCWENESKKLNEVINDYLR